MCGSCLRAIILGLMLACLASGIITAQSPTRGNPEGAKIKNAVAVTPESIAAGKTIFQRYCAACHGVDAKGGAPIGDVGPPPPNLSDERWDHGSSDGEIYYVIKQGVPPDFFMESWEDRISNTDLWNIVNYIRSLAPPK